MTTSRPRSEYWIINGDYYDLQSLIKHHPGGSYILELTRGLDVTWLFRTSHLNLPPITKYRVGSTTGQPDLNEVILDAESNRDHDYQQLKSRVKLYLQKQNLDPKAPPWYVGLCFVGTLISYGLWYLSLWGGHYNWMWLASLWYWVVAGNSFHDAAHYALHRNYLVRWYFVIFGTYISSSRHWIRFHNVKHHVYTNIPGLDLDLDVLHRTNPDQDRRWWHQYQDLYLMLEYSIYGAWLRGFIALDWDSSWLEYSIHLITYGYLAAGLWFQSSWIITGWLIIQLLVLSYLFAVFSQVNHIVPGAINCIPKQPVRWFGGTFLTHQISTSSSWSVSGSLSDRIMTILAAALNYQTIHHLFPTICSYHYPKIQPLLVEYCQEQGIKMLTYPDFRTAWWDHWSLVRKLSL